VLREIASQFQNWARNRSQKWGGPILEATEDRRDKFLDPDFRKNEAQPGGCYGERPRARPHPDRHRQQEGESLASAEA